MRTKCPCGFEADLALQHRPEADIDDRDITIWITVLCPDCGAEIVQATQAWFTPIPDRKEVMPNDADETM